MKSICFSSDGKYLASGGWNEKVEDGGKVSVLKGGLFMSLKFLPIDLIFPASKQEPTVPAYCFMDQHEPTLLQRLLDVKTDMTDFERLISKYPKLLFLQNLDAAATDSDSPSSIFHWALDNNNPKVLSLALASVFGTSSGGFHTAGERCVSQVADRIIKDHPDVWSKALKDMCLVPTRTTARESRVEKERCKTVMASTCASSQPWKDLHEDGSELLSTVAPMAQLGSLKLLTSMVKHCPITVMDNDVMGSVLEVMWTEYIQFYFLIDFAVYILMLISWTMFLEYNAVASSSGHSLVDHVFGGVVIVLDMVLIYKEVLSLGMFDSDTTSDAKSPDRDHSNGIVYFDDAWNVVDCLALTMTFVNVVLLLFLDSYNPNRSQLAACLITVTTGLLTAKFLGYLRGFDSTGWLITVLMQNGVDMSPFLVVLVSILCGFTIMFNSLFRSVEGDCELTLEYDDYESGQQVLGAECIKTPYESIAIVAFNVFNMAILGDFDANHFTGSLSPWTSRAFFVLMVLIVTVIALNALIALLGDSYSQVQDNKIGNKHMERAKLIVEYLKILPKEERQRIEGETKYFHVLIAKHRLDENGHIIRGSESDWEGGFSDTKRYIDNANAQLLKRMDEKMTATKTETTMALNKVEAKLEAMLEDKFVKTSTETKMAFAQLEAKFDKLFELLRKDSGEGEEGDEGGDEEEEWYDTTS